MTLIDNWRSAWRMASVNAAWLGGAAWAAWISLAPEHQQAVVRALGLDPTTWLPIIAAAGVIVARLIKQPAVEVKP